MIPRYSSPEIDRIFSPRATYVNWMRVEVATLTAQRLHLALPIPPPLIEALNRFLITSKVIDRIHTRELQVGHDVQAFVEVIPTELIYEAKRWFHFGLTASDVVDTAFALTIREAASLLFTSFGELLSAFPTPSDSIPALGRTHGQPARLLPWSHRLDVWSSSLRSCLDRLAVSAASLTVGRLRGPLGDYTPYLTPTVEAHALALLYLSPAPPSSQCLPRHLHAAFASDLALLLSVMEKIAVDLRLLAIPELHSFAAPPTSSSSSSMPHKANPASLERISGFARLARGHATALQESVPLWLERDISHSSVERVAIPDLFHLALAAIDTLASILPNLSFAPASQPPLDSYSLLHEAILAGDTRHDAYLHIQNPS